MNISLPDALKAFVDQQVNSRGYGTSSEYVRELIRKDQDAQALREMLLEGARSAAAAPVDTGYFQSLREPLDDIERAVDHYAQEAGLNTAYAFIDALERAYHFIGATPGAGSTRWAHELNLPGLRTLRIKGFPWLAFYMQHALGHDQPPPVSRLCCRRRLADDHAGAGYGDGPAHGRRRRAQERRHGGGRDCAGLPDLGRSGLAGAWRAASGLANGLYGGEAGRGGLSALVGDQLANPPAQDIGNEW
ncbi:hypothetical protein E4T56_gene6295 [Termitomyces sp. T112]|nr:hypothetical protein E4T56_gene6295 [Termitomyces sp. T112]